MWWEGGPNMSKWFFEVMQADVLETNVMTFTSSISACKGLKIKG